jgi:hypothetical protein
MSLLPVVVLSSAVACGGAKGKAKVSTEAKAEASYDFDNETLKGTSSSGPGSAVASDSDIDSGVAEPALLGARHDVRLSDPAKALVCKCLAAVSGSPGLSALRWSDVAPTIDVTTQTVVVIESEGVPCAESKSTTASYMGYHKEGQDIVVELEAAQVGRPVTRGAIVPRPVGGGHIRIAAPRSLPYGKAVEGDGPCTL